MISANCKMKNDYHEFQHKKVINAVILWKVKALLFWSSVAVYIKFGTDSLKKKRGGGVATFRVTNIWYI